MKLKDSTEAIERLNNNQEVWFYIVNVSAHGNSVSLRVPPSQVGGITQKKYRLRRSICNEFVVFCDRVYLMGKKMNPIKKSYEGSRRDNWGIQEVSFFSDRDSCVEAHNADLDKAIKVLNRRIEQIEECIAAFDTLKA